MDGEGSDVPVVETLSVERARRRRDEMLASAGPDERDLRDRAIRYMPDTEELMTGASVHNSASVNSNSSSARRPNHPYS